VAAGAEPEMQREHNATVSFDLSSILSVAGEDAWNRMKFGKVCLFCWNSFRARRQCEVTLAGYFIFDVPEVVIEAFQHPDENIPLVIFCVVTIILQSFLMFNFLVMLTSTPSLPVRCFLCDARSAHHFSSILVPSDTDLLLQIAIVLDAFMEAQAEHKECDVE